MSKKEQATEKKAKPQLFHEYLCEKIDSSDMKQLEMAEKMGFAMPNIITMFKQGKTRVPLEKVPGFAKILGLDQKMLLRMAMSEYHPELLAECERLFGGALVSKNEMIIVEAIRELSDGTDPTISSIEHKIAVGKFVKRLMFKAKSDA